MDRCLARHHPQRRMDLRARMDLRLRMARRGRMSPLGHMDPLGRQVMVLDMRMEKDIITLQVFRQSCYLQVR